MSQATEFENTFSQLLQEKKLDEARDHIIKSKMAKGDGTEPKYPDLEAMTRMARSRAIVLLEGKANQIQQEAMAPKFLKMSTDALMEELTAHVEAYKASGGPADTDTHPKGQTAAPAPVEGEGEGEKEPEETGEKKDEKKKRSRGVSAKKPGKGKDDKKDGKKAEKKDDKKPSEDPEPQKSTETPAETPAPAAIDMAAFIGPVEELGANINELGTKIDGLVEKNEEVSKELIVNLKGLIKSVQQNKDQEQRMKDAISEIGKVRSELNVLYEQQSYLVASINFLGGNLTSLSPDEFRGAALAYLKTLLEDAEQKVGGSSEGDDEKSGDGKE